MSLSDLQKAFTAHLRTPEAVPAPDDVDPARVAVYRRLVWKNISGLLNKNFPVCRKVLGEPAFDALGSAFLADHRATTPWFPRLAAEFVAYLEHERAANPAAAADPPFLADLAHYEWLEAKVLIDPADPAVPTESVRPLVDGESCLDRQVCVNPTLVLGLFRYPVHQISPDFMPANETPTIIAVFRDIAEQVRFVELNPVSAELLSMLMAADAPTPRLVALAIAEALGYADPAPVLTGAEATLSQWLAMSVVLGVRG